MDRNEFLILDIPLPYLPEHTEHMHVQLDNQWSAIRYLLLEEATGQDNPSALANLVHYVVSKLQTANPASIDYIHNHFKEPITLDTLAKLEHYHPVYYSSWFKKRTGKSVKNYITELRLNESKSLLVSTSWSMSRISEEVGFENSSSFTRWFRNSEGVAPQKYRILNNG
ncbi:helix-turn-helix transcriptional regulator [Planococcus massiliensis]|nr:AraC family transcriptional regulator [Planococcus massiliensis]